MALAQRVEPDGGSEGGTSLEVVDSLDRIRTATIDRLQEKYFGRHIQHITSNTVSHSYRCAYDVLQPLVLALRRVGYDDLAERIESEILSSVFEIKERELNLHPREMSLEYGADLLIKCNTWVFSVIEMLGIDASQFEDPLDRMVTEPEIADALTAARRKVAMELDLTVTLGGEEE